MNGKLNQTIVVDMLTKLLLQKMLVILRLV
jgi:hypothetical protein